MIIQKKWLFALLCTSLYSMEADKTQKIDEKIPQISLAEMTPEIAYYHLQKDLSFQEVGRLRRVSKGCRALYDPEKICPYFSQFECPTYACFKLAHNYYACTKALVHFACKKKEKIRKKDDEETRTFKEKKWQENIQKFQHLWQYHHTVRNYHGKYAMVYDQMKAYKKYTSQKDMCRHIVDEGELFLRKKKLADAQMIFSCGELNLFDLLKKAHIKNYKYWVYTEMIVSEVCTLNDIKLLHKLCGSRIDESFECIMTFASPLMIYYLINNNIMPYDMVDEDKKSILHYAAEYGYDNVIKLLFEKGLYVNIVDNNERTPMHYAMKYGKKKSVEALFMHPDADIRYIDKKGRTAYDYSKIMLRDSSEVKEGKKAIRALFKPLMENNNNQNTIIHYNGYQKLQ